MAIFAKNVQTDLSTRQRKDLTGQLRGVMCQGLAAEAGGTESNETLCGTDGEATGMRILMVASEMAWPWAS